MASAVTIGVDASDFNSELAAFERALSDLPEDALKRAEDFLLRGIEGGALKVAIVDSVPASGAGHIIGRLGVFGYSELFAAALRAANGDSIHEASPVNSVSGDSERSTGDASADEGEVR